MPKINPIDLQKHLKGISYPVSKENLINHIQDGGAKQDLIAALEQIPDKQYDAPTDVSKAVSSID